MHSKLIIIGHHLALLDVQVHMSLTLFVCPISIPAGTVILIFFYRLLIVCLWVTKKTIPKM